VIVHGAFQALALLELIAADIVRLKNGIWSSTDVIQDEATRESEE
jgi:hypothetical protein